MPFLLLSPTTIRLGDNVSFNELPSLKNSGEKTILLFLYSSLNDSVKPTGMVDLITITLSSFCSNASLNTALILLTSKLS